MLDFLSDEWIAALDTAGSAGGAASRALPTEGPALTIEQRVNAPGGSLVVYAVLVFDDEVRVQSGPATDPDVTFITDRSTAAAIAQGQLSAQAAFMSGDLQLVGETSALLRAQAALADLSDRFASVRARTNW